MQADLAALLSRPIAHRGLHDGGGLVENSIGAARAAIVGGYGIECDVQLSRDGEAMVFHDEDLTRLTGEPGRLRDFDADALCRLRLGGGQDRVPRLQDLLAAVAGRVALVIEIKSANDGDVRLTDRTLALLEGYRGPVAIESFDPAVVRRCRQRGSSRAIGLVGAPDKPATLDERAVATSDFLSWSVADLASAAAAYPEIPLTTWTVRTREQETIARQCKAQIVFEGLIPSSIVKDVAREDRGLSR